ncbi:hypothetical protein LZ31DRAFT_172687 [Colletotrichum somersetense]|nr:hypothetical protein LZ31DRAFT_172687 [Colletotrichum somersetense]
MLAQESTPNTKAFPQTSYRNVASRGPSHVDHLCLADAFLDHITHLTVNSCSPIIEAIPSLPNTEVFGAGRTSQGLRCRCHLSACQSTRQPRQCTICAGCALSTPRNINSVRHTVTLPLKQPETI